MSEPTVLDNPTANPYASPTTDAEISYASYTQEPPPSVLGTLFSFRGRVPRRVYWGVQLLGSTSYLLIMFGLFWALGEESPAAWAILATCYIPFVWILFASQVKRWHDRDKSGWYVLVNFIPYLGAIWTLIECGCLRGSQGPNRFGPDHT